MHPHDVIACSVGMISVAHGRTDRVHEKSISKPGGCVSVCACGDRLLQGYDPDAKQLQMSRIAKYTSWWRAQI